MAMHNYYSLYDVGIYSNREKIHSTLSEVATGYGITAVIEQYLQIYFRENIPRLLGHQIIVTYSLKRMFLLS